MQGKIERESGAYTKYVSVLSSLLTPQCTLQRDLKQILSAYCLVFLLLLSSCGTLPSYRPADNNVVYSKKGNPPYYDVFGKRYYTLTQCRGYVATGLASWYGIDFQGKKTSSGEIYDRFKYTAAHPTLPIPCLVEVENLENNKKVVVRINDRGPFHGDRLLDLSYAAAKKLDFVTKGTSKVHIKALDYANNKNSPIHFLQAGVFRDKALAEKLASQLRKTPVGKVSITQGEDATQFLVKLGPLNNPEEAERVFQYLNTKGITNPQFITD